MYLSQDTLFDRSGLERVNLEIGKGNVPVFHSKKEAVVKTVDQMDDEVHERSKTKSSFFGQFVSIMKAISSNRLKTVLLSFIISLVLVVFSSTYYLSVFDGLDRGNDSYFRKSDTYVLQKGSLDDINGVSSIRPLYLGYIDEEDEKALSTAFGDKKVYRLYRYGHPYVSTFSKFAQGSNVDFDLDGLDPRAIEDGRGLLVCDEAFIRKNLRISEIGFVKEASALKRSGVYITDYLADSMMSSSPEVYGSYDDLVGPLYPAKETPDNLVPIESIYVNGIIRTDYQKKIPNLLRYAEKGGKDHSYLVYGECQDESDYLLNALTQYYTTDSSFFEDVKKEETRKVDCQYLSLSNGEDIDVHIPMYVVFSPELKDDEVILPSGFIRNYLFDTESHFIQEYNGREDSKKMSLSYGLRVYDERECISESVSVKRLRRMEDLSKDARPYLPSPVYSVVVSRDSFYRLQGAVSLPTRYYFDGYSDADGIYSLLKKRNFYEKTLKSELDLTAAYYVSSLSPLLRFCSRFALAASFVSLCSYSVLLVMDNRYRIGVWKAIGYRGKSLSLYFLLCSVFFLLGTAVLYVCSAFVFDMLLNGILSQAVYTTLKCASRPPFVFLSFSVMDFLEGLGVSFLLSALSELVYLFFFRKIRADRVLRRKE